jgi:hypothetical protein
MRRVAVQNDGVFNVDPVSVQNLKELTGESLALYEERICEIAYIAGVIASASMHLLEDGLSISDALALVSDSRSDFTGEAIRPEVNTVFSTEGFLSGVDDIDKATFAEILAEKLLLLGYEVSESDFLPTDGAAETFTYVKSVLADEAFDVFSQNFADPRVAYAGSFKEACFAVADGKVGYCILPLEEKGGARIPGIYSLMLGLDLKINEVTPVFGPEGTSDMKYALLGRGFSIPEREEDTDRYLEIRFDKSAELGELFHAARKFGLSVYRINTMYSGDSESPEEFYSVVFKDGGGGFSTLLTYLAIFFDGYTSVGIYKNLE